MTNQSPPTLSERENRARQLEQFAARKPGRYRFNVMCLALLGYLYIVAILAAILAALAGVIYLASFRHMHYVGFKLAIPLVGLAYLVLRSLFVRIPAPEGLSLERSRAGALWRDIEHIQRRLKSPKVHRVLLTNDFNAGVVQVPLIGFFGFHTNYLIIGVPMLLALSPQHFRAVLAHEFGHLSCEHGRTGAFIYRVRSSWGRLLDFLDASDSWGKFLVARFVTWYAPFLTSYSYALARSQEFEADQVAVRITSPAIAAETLSAIQLYGMRLDKVFWPEIYARANNDEPVPAPFSLMEHAFRVPFEQAEEQEYFSRALAEQTCGVDSHPSFSQRLAGIGGTPSLPPLTDGTAASYYLGDMLPGVIASFDQEWQGRIAERWEERKTYVGEARDRLADLRDKAARETLGKDESWQFASLLEDISGGATALPHYRQLAAQFPDCAEAQFAAGRILLAEQEDEGGIPYLERAMDLRHNFVIEGCDLITTYLQRRGRSVEADQYYGRLVRQAELYKRAAGERNTVTSRDQLKPHSASPEELDSLCRQLSASASVRKVYLAEKVVQLYPEDRLFVLGIEFRLPWYRFRSEQKELKQLSQLANSLDFPGETVLLNLAAKANRKTLNTLKKMPGALLYCAP